MSEPVLRLRRTDSSLEGIFDDFARDMRRRDRSPKTIHIYKWAIDDLVAFLRVNDVHDLADVTRDNLERWQDQLLDRKLKPNSRQAASSAARALIRWAADRDIIDWRLERAIVSVKVKKRKRRPIPAEDLAKIIRWLGPRRPHMELVQLRDRAMFFYYLVTAARVSEALQALRKDYIAPVIIQKGGGEKTLRTTPSVLDMINDYLSRRHDDSPWLFVKHGNNISATGERLEPSGVREACKRIALQLQIPYFSPHRIRHTSASYLANKGESPAAIAALLGHANLDTVYEYIEIDEPMLRQLSSKLEQLIKPEPRALPRASRRSWSDYVGR